jgi:O-antigen ligase
VKLRLVAIVAAATIVVFLSLGENASGLTLRLINRWDAAQNTNDLTAGRSQIWAAGLALSSENPVGYGIGQAKFLLAQRSKLFVLNRDNIPMIDAHNEYLRVLLDSGYVGFTLYLMGCIFLVFIAGRIFRQRREVWPLATLLLMLTFFISGSGGFIKIVWIVLGLITGRASKGPTVRGTFAGGNIRASNITVA